MTGAWEPGNDLVELPASTSCIVAGWVWERSIWETKLASRTVSWRLERQSAHNDTEPIHFADHSGS